MKERMKTFFRYRFLLGELVKKGIKLKYRRSYLGILWSLLEPLLTTCVLTIVFGTLFGNNDPTFPVYILSGRLLYTFFSQGTTGALKSIRANASMIKKVYVPKYLYPLASIMFNYIIFLISLVVLAALALVFKVYPTIYLLNTIPCLLLLLILSFGVGMVLATIGVFFRDMEYLWNVLLMLVMYTCAIFYYPKTLLESNFGWILRGNPLYCIIYNFRNAIFGEAMDVPMFIYAAGCSIAAVIIGAFMFYKKQDEFILQI